MSSQGGLDTTFTSDGEHTPPVAVVIPAKDEETTIASTVRSAKALPGVKLIVVVDDGSHDNTKNVARAAGAVGIRHTVNRGKASAMETGANVVSMHEPEGAEPYLLLFLDADLGESSAEAAPLIEPVATGKADCTIAVLPPQKGAGGRGFVKNLSRRAIYHFTGWKPVAPLSGQRCLTREAYLAAVPLAEGWGVETAMTIAILRRRLTIQEVPCEFGHRVSTNSVRGQIHRFHQFVDVWKTVIALKTKQIGRIGILKALRHPSIKGKPEPSVDYEPFRMAPK